MAETTIVKIQAQTRPQDKNPRQLRKDGLLPVSVYGKNLNLNVAIDSHEFKLAYGKNKDAKFEVEYEGKSYSTVTKNVQINFATNEIQSVEFALDA